MRQTPAHGFSAKLRMPCAVLGVTCRAGLVTELEYLPPEVETLPPQDSIAERVAHQLAAYLEDPHHRFDLPLAPYGSDFQHSVWQAICAIEVGATATYQQIARDLHSAPRAIGQACGANAYPLVIPCHRVVASGGIGGFGHRRDGFPIRVKRWLLAHERG